MMNSNHGSLENIILNAIWNMEENFQETISVLDVQNKINSISNQNWAYTTVKTVMDRLVDKSMVERFKSGKKYFYKTIYSRAEMGQRSIRKIAAQFYNDDIEMLLKAVEKTRNESLTLV